MTLSGLVLRNARTGMDACILDADEANGRRFVLEYTVPPGAPEALIDAHRHRHWSETFEVLAGTARYREGRTERGLAEGERVTLPPGVDHMHPWNAGAERLRVRQTTTLLRPDPEAIRDTVKSFAMLFWLASEGRVDARGRPAPLQGAVILRALQRHGGFLAGPPAWAQRVLVGVLAAVADRRGVVAFDPACLGPDGPFLHRPC